MSILRNGSATDEVTITLFGRYSANIIVNQHHGENKTLKGYVLTWKDVTEYVHEIKEGQRLLEELYTLVMETLVNGTLLVPITGIVTREHMEKMTEKSLSIP